MFAILRICSVFPVFAPPYQWQQRQQQTRKNREEEEEKKINKSISTMIL